jgi:hypothetical protein
LLSSLSMTCTLGKLLKAFPVCDKPERRQVRPPLPAIQQRVWLRVRACACACGSFTTEQMGLRCESPPEWRIRMRFVAR